MNTWSYPKGGPPVVREDGVVVRPAPAVLRDWIVIQGTIGGLVNTVRGGGYEFFGPFTYAEAQLVLGQLPDAVSVQLAKLPRLIEAHRDLA